LRFVAAWVLAIAAARFLPSNAQIQPMAIGNVLQDTTR
jgi:hypothetical protein